MADENNYLVPAHLAQVPVPSDSELVPLAMEFEHLPAADPLVFPQA